MSGIERRYSSSQPVPWHRMIFGLLVVITVAAPLAIWILGVQHQAHDADSVRTLLRIWTGATAGMLVWSAIYVVREPQLVRIAVSVVGALFLLLAIFARINATVSGQQGGKGIADSHPASSPSATAVAQKQSSDSGDIAGVWMTGQGYAWTFSPNGTFTFRDDKGNWSKKGDQVVAQAEGDGGATWKLTLSADGQKMSGTWAAPSGDTGTVAVTRAEAGAARDKSQSGSGSQKSNKLADFLVGKWKLANHSQTMEFREGEPAFTVITDGGQSLKFKYTVADETHLNVLLPMMPDQADPVPWEVTTANQDQIDVKQTPKGKPVTYNRVH